MEWRRRRRRLDRAGRPGASSSSDRPGRTSVAIIEDNLARNVGSLSALVVMGVALLFLATAVRNLLSGEASEATYSSVAYGG